MSVVELLRVKLTSSPGNNQYVCFKSENGNPPSLVEEVVERPDLQATKNFEEFQKEADGNNCEAPRLEPVDPRTSSSSENESNDAPIDSDSDHESEESEGEDDDKLGYSHQQSSKNKRKNFQPRNIVDSFPNFTRYPDVVNGASELPLDLSDNTPTVDPSVAKHAGFRPTDDIEDKLVIDEDGDNGSAIDLSTCVKQATVNPLNSIASSPSAKAQLTSALLNNINRVSGAVQSHDAMTSSADASAMKNYAEDTMKELLGLYGLNNEMVESITQNVPLQNFSSGKILENLGNSQLPGSPTSMSAQQAFLNSHLNSLTNMCKAPTSSATNLLNGVNNNNNEDSTAKGATTSDDTMSEELKSRVVEGMSKLAAISPNNIIGNPRVILPQNMATTLLTIAALSNGQASSTAKAANLTQEPVKMDHSLQSSPIMPSTPTNQSAVKFPPSPASLLNRSSTEAISPSSMSSNHPSSINITSSSPSNKIISTDYSRYVKRYNNAIECASAYCKDLNYREHFHCLDCNSRVFIKKEEMIRHFKWHKKRDESLQHGFLRYSPMDDCSEKFPNCSHNRKQTHYHCLKESCDKVYISTSDVQMHANCHRKDSAIIKEGFQRFRATEDCGTPSCAFYGQRTTHFHCRRSGCNFNFKNKADMEKHKSYHIKDEQLNKDGFKKFMKHEHCAFENCRFSRVCNHIHCIRPGCSYVLHSSGQLYSHKRKHERRDNEMAYRKFKLQQSMIKALGENSNNSLSSEQGSIGEHNNFASALKTPTMNTLVSNSGSSTPVNQASTSPVMSHFGNGTIMNSNINEMPVGNEALTQSFAKFATMLSGVNIANASSLVPTNLHNGDATDSALPSAIDLSGGDSASKTKFGDSWKKYMKRFSSTEPCKSNCEYLYKDHYHCLGENCDMTFKSRDGVREHTRNHEQQDQVTEAFYSTCGPGDIEGCPAECTIMERDKHYHCNWEDCKEILTPIDKPFRRLDHYKMHEYSQKLTVNKDSFNFIMASNADSIFKRKRGRPPKNRVIEVCDYPTASSPSKMPQAVFTSFKLPKSNSLSPMVPSAESSNEDQTELNLSKSSTDFAQMPSQQALVPSPDTKLPTGTVGEPTVPAEIETQEGFYIFKEDMSCPDSMCMFMNKHHYHCTQPRCFYITDRSDILILHSKDFHDNIDISEGFVFFDRNVDCRLKSCPNNKINRHFHCTRPGCDYSFVRYSTMSIHEQRHSDTDAKSQHPDSPLSNNEQDNLTKSPNVDLRNDWAKTVKAAGTYYPLSAFSNSGVAAANSDKDTSGSRSGCSSPASSSSQDLDGTPVKQFEQTPAFTFDVKSIENHALYGAVNSCGRPFCKLKKRDHYHCNICNQAFSHLDRLKPHILKHTGTTSPISHSALGENGVASENSVSNGEMKPEASGYKIPVFTSANMAALASVNPSMFTSQGIPLMHPAQSLMAAQGLNLYLYGMPHMDMETFLRNSGNMANAMLPGTSLLPQTPTSNSDKVDARDSLKRHLPGSATKVEESVESKRMKMSCLRILKDEPVPDGYIRFRFNEDCQYTHCGYREHQTHFHCMRKDCGYSFCDKTRFVQHTARHERLDTLMGGDFQQYRANVHCGRSECVYANTIGAMANKASHFHCLKCDFVCTDTNKVVAHRRQHSKLDSIMAAGFEKFTPSQSCQIDNCSHNGRQTHYHCITCQYAVLGLSQMSAHRYRHLE